MSKIEVFQGESKNFRLTVTTGGNTVSGLEVAVIQNHARKVVEFSLGEGSIVLEGDDIYTFELTAAQSEALAPGGYAIEGKVVTSGGTTVKPLAELVVKIASI